MKAANVPKEARERLKLAQDADGGNRAAALEDLKFEAGDQWPVEIKTARLLDKRPCLTINKTQIFAKQIVNNMRQQRPRIQIHPVADGADEVKAKVIQGLCRHIEVNSNAEFAYDNGAEFQVKMGWGYWRVLTRYIAEDSFDQEIYIDAIKNPFSVYLDPSSTAPDGSDAMWCIITQRMKISAFKKEYPKAKVVGIGQLGGGDELAQWANGEEIVVAEYYRIEEEPENLILLSTGQKVFESDMPPEDVMASAGIHKVSERMSARRTLKWSKITAVEELDSRELPGKHIPVIPVYGAELLEHGKTIRYGMVRQLKDPQRMYNFWRTQETEFVALAPKAPWLVSEGQTEGRELEWAEANIKNRPTLTYKAVEDAQGNALPPPMRQQPQPIPAASVNAAMSASEDLKAVAGMFDPALGAPGQETSGTMVQQRQQQSDLSNFHFYDNLTRSIRWTAKILLEWIPTYYDTERVIRILGEDGQPQVVKINEQAIDKVLNDVTIGTYDVVMETGPGYQTKREQAFADMLEMGKAFPELFQACGDLILRQSDSPGASDMADRLAAMNPLAQIGKELPEDLDPQVKAMLMQSQGQLQMAQKQLQQLQMEKAAHVFGVQAKEQAVTQRTQMQEQEESTRQMHRENAETHRTVMQIAGRLRETAMKDHTSLTETVIDAHTDLEIARRQAMNHGKPDGART